MERKTVKFSYRLRSNEREVTDKINFDDIINDCVSDSKTSRPFVSNVSLVRFAYDHVRLSIYFECSHIGLFNDTVLNVRKHIFERKHRKSSRNCCSIVSKWSLVIGCNKSMIRHCVI